jgi:acetyl esterase/lipase
MQFINHGKHERHGSFADACDSVFSVSSVVRLLVSNLLLALFLFFHAVAISAQENSPRERFKHEKHGAIVFASGDGYELKCDIYQPKSDEPRPIMLAIHGGAWTTGTKFAMFRHARILANRGYVVMAINYRLAPDHKWPAQIHDCKHAVRWIREHADKYNADPDRVYAFGYSAGGHLASMLATTDKDDGLEGTALEPYAKHSSRIDGLIAGGSPMEFSWIDEESTSLKYWLDATRISDPEKYDQASPISFITDDDPVAVIFHGTSDSLVPTSSPESFVERYKKANIESEMILTPDGHAGAFSRTSLLIESLTKLETMLAKEKCKAKISAIRALTNAFVKAKGHLPMSFMDPVSTDDLMNFATTSENIEPSAYKEMMLNDRDGKQFEFSWSSKDGVIVKEAIGIDGERLSSRRNSGG